MPEEVAFRTTLEDEVSVQAPSGCSPGGPTGKTPTEMGLGSVTL